MTSDERGLWAPDSPFYPLNSSMIFPFLFISRNKCPKVFATSIITNPGEVEGRERKWWKERV